VADVVAEVTESVRIYENARWICAPCHRLQPVSPTANILAMYDTIHALGDRRNPGNVGRLMPIIRCQPILVH